MQARERGSMRPTCRSRGVRYMVRPSPFPTPLIGEPASSPPSPLKGRPPASSQLPLAADPPTSTGAANCVSTEVWIIHTVAHPTEMGGATSVRCTASNRNKKYRTGHIMDLI